MMAWRRQSCTSENMHILFTTLVVQTAVDHKHMKNFAPSRTQQCLLNVKTILHSHRASVCLCRVIKMQHVHDHLLRELHDHGHVSYILTRKFQYKRPELLCAPSFGTTNPTDASSSSRRTREYMCVRIDRAMTQTMIASTSSRKVIRMLTKLGCGPPRERLLLREAGKSQQHCPVRRTDTQSRILHLHPRFNTCGAHTSLYPTMMTQNLNEKFYFFVQNLRPVSEVHDVLTQCRQETAYRSA